jgi:two-component system heavy metal sensor histidine kinase CusS
LNSNNQSKPRARIRSTWQVATPGLSLTARLGLLFSGAMTLSMFVSGFVLEHAIEQQFRKHDLEELDGKFEVMRETLASVTSLEALANLQVQLHNTVMAGHPHSALTIVQNNGNTLLSMGQPSVVRRLLAPEVPDESSLTTWTTQNRTHRIKTERIPIGVAGSNPVQVSISFDITSDREFVATFIKLLWLAMGVGTIATGLVGWSVVRKGLAPLHSVSATLANVSSSALDNAIPIEGVPNDLQELVSSFNRMLARLNDSFKRLSEFSSDIAHELRTPINNMMLHTQVALGRPRTIEEYCTNLQSNLEELRRLSRMIEDMLFLANADNCLLAPRLESIDLQEEIAKLVEFFDIAASEQDVRLVQRGKSSTVYADRLMVQRALSNLLSNALRFTTRGKAIEVDIDQGAEGISVSVANSGPEISKEHLSKIFDRLYRIDISRREGRTLNVGLGLAITKSIMEIHGGTVMAESGMGRTCFTVRFPCKETIAGVAG